MRVDLCILEHCNFRCRYCYAKFGSNYTVRFDEWRGIIDNIVKSGDVDIFNIIGGEPLLHPDFMDIVRYIKSLGIKASFVTNGYLLTNDFISNNTICFDEIGLSVNSFDPLVNLESGHCVPDMNFFTFSGVEQCISEIKNHSDAIVRINTVVGSSNKSDVIAAEVKYLGINRWKILKVQSFGKNNFDKKDISVTDEEYHSYVKKALGYFKKEYRSDQISYNIDDKLDIIVEYDMKRNRIIVDPNGYLVFDHEPLINCRFDDFKDGLKRLSIKKNHMNGSF